VSRQCARAAVIVEGTRGRCAAGFLPMLLVAVAGKATFQQEDENWKKEMGK